MKLHIVEKQIEGVSILDFAGSIMLGNETDHVRARINELLCYGKHQIVLDLGGVGSIDSVGLGILIAGYIAAQKQGTTLKIANLTKGVRELLNITKLATVFETYDNIDDAVKSFAMEAVEVGWPNG